MTRDVKYCFDDQDIEEVSQNMGTIQVRRLPVVNHDERLVGILSLGDVAIGDRGIARAEALHGISCPGDEYTQTG
jgi:Mg/Co/Ni transporter MgtE